MKRALQDVLEIPNYSPAEASRYFHISHSTLSYWTEEPNPLIPLSSEGMLSFKNMVELYVLEGLRSLYNVKTHRIRAAVEYLLDTEKSRHPLADYDIETDGKYVQFYRGKRLLNASLLGQYEMDDVMRSYLHRVERDPHGVAQRIFPYTKREQLDAGQAPPRTVEINPGVCFGLPVLADSRITTGFLASRYRGGDSVPVIAKSYGRSATTIKEAIEWELGREIRAA
jgi:uncharacterized protein (DUF433 family)